jgi:hypothetical protein
MTKLVSGEGVKLDDGKPFIAKVTCLSGQHANIVFHGEDDDIKIEIWRERTLKTVIYLDTTISSEIKLACI